MDAQALYDKLAYWEIKEREAERAAAYARVQQARIVGELAVLGVHLFPALEPEE